MSARARYCALSAVLAACAGGCTIETAEASPDTTPVKAEAFAPTTSAVSSGCRNVFGYSACPSADTEPTDAEPSAAPCQVKDVKMSVDTKVTTEGASTKTVHASIDEECIGGTPNVAPSSSTTPNAPLSETTAIVSTYVLASIPYRDCGSGGSGSVDVAFDTTGAVTSVDVQGGWNASIKACIAQRFRAAKVPSFSTARTIRWPIKLPDSGDSSGGWGS